MKKLFAILLVMCIALPAMALEITVVDNGDGTATVGYDATGDETLPRAFGIELTTDAGTFEAVSGLSADFDIYPGSIVIVDGVVTDAGSPVADASTPGAAGSGIGTAKLVIEMASLYDATTEDAPGLAGDLLTVTVSEECHVSVALNGTRGGIVLEDAEAAVAPVLAQGVLVAAPSAVCVGDVDGNGFVNKLDIGNLVNYLNANAVAPFWTVLSSNPAYNEAADIDGNGFVNKLDIGNLVNYLNANASAPFWTVVCQN